MEVPTWEFSRKRVEEGRDPKMTAFCMAPSCCAERAAEHPDGPDAGWEEEDARYARWIHGLKGRGLRTSPYRAPWRQPRVREKEHPLSEEEWEGFEARMANPKA